MQKRGQASPDDGDALALTFAQVEAPEKEAGVDVTPDYRKAKELIKEWIETYGEDRLSGAVPDETVSVRTTWPCVRVSRRARGVQSDPSDGTVSVQNELEAKAG